jgi:hypothetical protein
MQEQKHFASRVVRSGIHLLCAPAPGSNNAIGERPR